MPPTRSTACSRCAGADARCERAGHVAFAVADVDLPPWRDHLEANGIAIESEVTSPRGGRSIYVRDPAGNSVELASPRIWGIPK